MRVTVVFFLLSIAFIGGCASSYYNSTSSYSRNKEMEIASYSLPNNVYKERFKLYRVRKGDTLAKISRRFGVPIEDILRTNSISNPNRIKVGETIRIPLGENIISSESKKGIFIWPVKGDIINHFGKVVNNKVNKGIDISTGLNAPVKCVDKGSVSFVGTIKGYGKTVIIEHNYLGLTTIYTNLSEIFVKKDDFVNKGDIIGTTAKDTTTGASFLHFEIRKGVDAINPLVYLM